MQDRASFMGVSDMPALRQIENVEQITRSYPIQLQKRKQSLNSTSTGTEAMATGTISSSSSLSCISSTQPQQTDTINDDMNDDLSSQSMNSYSTSGRPNPMMAIKDVTPILASKNGSNITTKKSSMNVLKKLNSADNGKHDTRIVNEAFQDAVSMLENGFGSKMQAEMLVLVDVLHKPAAIFPKNSSFRIESQDKRFIGK